MCFRGVGDVTRVARSSVGKPSCGGVGGSAGLAWAGPHLLFRGVGGAWGVSLSHYYANYDTTPLQD